MVGCEVFYSHKRESGRKRIKDEDEDEDGREGGSCASMVDALSLRFPPAASTGGRKWSKGQGMPRPTVTPEMSFRSGQEQRLVVLFACGLVLYDHDKTVPFGERLFAAPISVLW